MDVVMIVFGFLAFAVLMETIVKIQKMRMSESRGSGRLSVEDTREIQELYKGFEQLSRRVEALETILMGQVRKR